MSGSQAIKGSSLFVRVALGIVAGFLLLHGGTLTYYNHEKMVDEAGAFAAATGERALTIAEAARQQPNLLELLSTPSFSLSYQEQAVEKPRRVWPHSDEVGAVLRRRLIEQGFPDPEQVRFWYGMDSRGRHLVLQLPVDGRWLVARAEGPIARGHSVAAAFWSTLFGGSILLVVLWTTRRFTRVLPRVAEAAERVGRDTELVRLPEKGPREIRRLTRTFNAMQDRVNGLLAERTAMLGALSHDVRTMVTRLSLRMENLQDETLREKTLQDVATITALLDGALDYARDQSDAGRELPVDLPSMIHSLLDDEADLGAKTEYSGPDSLVVVSEPNSLRRVFANLIDNALRYGGAVSVSVREEEGRLLVDVSDPGPGIPEAQQELALRPYSRLEPSRSRETGGTGLGLSIARSIVEKQGGVLSFIRSESAFTVRVNLPRTANRP